MRYYLLLFVAVMLLALALPYTGVRTRDGEIAVAMNRDGTMTLSTPTYERPPPRPYENVPGCDFPQLGDDAKLVLLSAYDTQSISSTALANEEEISVGAGTLTVEDGDTPLYIVLVSFDPVIWQVKGAVDRVRYLVLVSEASNGTFLTLNQPHTETLVGATGIDAGKVRFLPNKCMHYFKSKDSPQAALAAEAIQRYTGRKPDVIAGVEHVNGFAAPSGEIDQLSRGGSPFRTLVRRVMGFLGLGAPLKPAEAELEYDMDSFYPGGVTQVDARTVVSIQPARPYSVLPKEAGLLQLLHRGDLTPDDNGNNSFVINRPIRFPAGLYGGHSRHFVLAPGVALPTGIAGHSCVVAQDTGKALLSDGICGGTGTLLHIF